MKLRHALLPLLIAPLAAHAATITWSSSAATVSGSFGQTLNTGLFNTADTFVLAEQIGGAGLTFDGITFSATSAIASDSLTFAGGSGVGGTFSGTGLGSAAVFHDSGASLLSRDGAFSNNGTLGTVAFTGLTIGNSYRVQALVYDGRGSTTGRTVQFDGINQGQYANGVNGVTWGNGLLVTGTFTADNANQSFTIQGFNTGNASTGAQLNALTLFQTSAIPEPSTYGLMGAGALAGLALVRRRRHAALA